MTTPMYSIRCLTGSAPAATRGIHRRAPPPPPPPPPPRVRARRARERLAQPSVRQRFVRQIVLAGDDEIDVAREPQVLKAVIENVDGCAKLVLGKAAAGMPIGADDDADALAGERTRQHQ